MRLVTWNANMGFHRKYQSLLDLGPDIAVVQEVANIETLRAKAPDFAFTDAVWVGENTQKGIAVFTFDGSALAVDSSYNPDIVHVVPVHVRGKRYLNLLAVWAFNGRDKGRGDKSLGQIRQALQEYGDFTDSNNLIIAGDFNNNASWDRGLKPNNFREVCRALEERNCASVYHRKTGSEWGKETDKTLFWRDRNSAGPHNYHVDYVFVSNGLLAEGYRFGLGNFEDWCGAGLSDHVPLILDISID